MIFAKKITKMLQLTNCQKAEIINKKVAEKAESGAKKQKDSGC